MSILQPPLGQLKLKSGRRDQGLSRSCRAAAVHMQNACKDTLWSKFLLEADPSESPDPVHYSEDCREEGPEECLQAQTDE